MVLLITKVYWRNSRYNLQQITSLFLLFRQQDENHLPSFHISSKAYICPQSFQPSISLLYIDCAGGHLLVENHWFFFVSKVILIVFYRLSGLKAPKARYIR